MNLFGQRKNKRYSYTPKHLKNEEKEARDTMESQWKEVRNANHRKKSFLISLPFLVLFLITVLVLLYILSRYE
ncbi:hypothetical protein BKM32_13845 [Mangrovimonas sp. DI 80]|nr:hypothetical protein BKM32_13845 [Mangrovimonas sp. DI 80]